MCLKNNLDFSKNKICNLSIVNNNRKTARLPQCAGLPPAPALRLFFFTLLILVSPVGPAQESGGLLTNAMDVISLPAEQASRPLKVSLTGVVTAADPVLKGRFFVQDSTGGVLVDNPIDVSIISKPGWVTPRRLWIGFVIVGSVLIVVMSWAITLSRKNSALNFLIAEREKAQRVLQQANDQLEERVKERTAQLKFEITTRKESEVQFKAVLTERTRLARELHDTVEQTLTGIALQLDAASKLRDRSPENSLRHLELARSLVAKSQVEVRQSVWDLRSRALEQFDLATALAEGARQITSGTNVQVHLETRGEPRFLPEVVEENLLRIGQEALANIIKHSGATQANIELQFERQQVGLRVKDNGTGFDPEKAAGPGEGHFGLLGMSERAKRLDGRFILSSKPGAGTSVCVEIPLNPSLEFQPPEVDSMDAI